MLRAANRTFTNEILLHFSCVQLQKRIFFCDATHVSHSTSSRNSHYVKSHYKNSISLCREFKYAFSE